MRDAADEVLVVVRDIGRRREQHQDDDDGDPAHDVTRAYPEAGSMRLGHSGTQSSKTMTDPKAS